MFLYNNLIKFKVFEDKSKRKSKDKPKFYLKIFYLNNVHFFLMQYSCIVIKTKYIQTSLFTRIHNILQLLIFKVIFYGMTK